MFFIISCFCNNHAWSCTKTCLCLIIAFPQNEAAMWHFQTSESATFLSSTWKLADYSAWVVDNFGCIFIQLFSWDVYLQVLQTFFTLFLNIFCVIWFLQINWHTKSKSAVHMPETSKRANIFPNVKVLKYYQTKEYDLWKWSVL